MKKTLFYLLIFSVLNIGGLTAQTHRCTTGDDQSIKDRLLHNRAKYANVVHVRNAITWVPIQFHILADNDGSNAVRPSKILEMLCALNEDYADQEVQFYLKDEFNVIKKTSTNNNPNLWNPVTQNTFTSAKVVNAINIFIAAAIPSSPGSTFQSAGFYQPGFDWIVVKRDQISASDAETLTHEIGHFLTLPHPFSGWAQEVTYDIATFGNPAPANTPSGALTERMDGSNCSSAGDLICDTPPSYNFGTAFGCNYTGGVMDPNGVLVNPDETNYMDYFLGCATNFTPMQKAAIFDDIVERGFGTSGIDNTPITAVPQLTSPINGATTPAFNFVGLDWEPVAGATKYLVDVDNQPSFGNKRVSKVVSGGTYVEFDGILNADFAPGFTYYWRVTPFNEGNFCGLASTFGSFVAGDANSVDEIKEVLNYTISPNPVSSNDILNINIETVEGFDAKITLFDLAGKKVKEINQDFGLGMNNYQLSVEGLNEGMYLLSIESESGILNEKIVVTK